MNEYRAILSKLIEVGAGASEHFNGPLIDHLEGTHTLLKEWENCDALCKAGLCHALYSTAAFKKVLVSINDRSELTKLIGEDAESIVYCYCACDRDYLYPQISEVATPTYRNRFTLEENIISSEALAYFCELTVANDCEIAHKNQAFFDGYWASHLDLYLRMKPYISNNAYRCVGEIRMKWRQTRVKRVQDP